MAFEEWYMQVSELVRATSVPLATVKYYLREGLLPAARKLTARSSEYGEEHIRRLTLLRMLREIGAIPVGRLRELVDAVDNPLLTEHEVFGRASDAIASSAIPPEQADAESRELVDQVLDAVGWSGVRRDAVDVDNLARVVAQIRRTGLFLVNAESLALYASVADTIGRAEIRRLPDTDDRAVRLERMVVGTVAYGRVLTILRRLSEEHHHSVAAAQRTL
jgi:DNA-binding transcriptional MerR regulator